MITILAQIISIFAAAFNIFSYQMKDNRRLFLSKGISGALFAVNFILLGNFTAGALNAVNLLRGAVLAGGEKWHKKRWLFLVQGLYLLCCVVTFGKNRTMIGGAVFAMVVSLLATTSQLVETAILPATTVNSVNAKDIMATCIRLNIFLIRTTFSIL